MAALLARRAQPMSHLGRWQIRQSGGAPIRYITSEAEMRGILFWLLGIPIPIIIALYLFDVI